MYRVAAQASTGKARCRDKLYLQSFIEACCKKAQLQRRLLAKTEKMGMDLDTGYYLSVNRWNEIYLEQSFTAM